MKVIITHGLPASGKSTWAKELIKSDPSYQRVNRDELRHMLNNYVFSKENEAIVTDIEYYIISTLLISGKNVIVDNTHLNPKSYNAVIEYINKIKDDCKLEIEIETKDFEIDINECLRRDALRGDSAVGSKVILKMYNDYLRKEYTPSYKEDLPFCIICDIDGTLAFSPHRSPYDMTKIKDDVVNMPVKYIINHIYAGATIKTFIFSGREDKAKDDTTNWLMENNIQFNGLFMRKTGDFRKDAIIKRELYEEHIKDRFNVLGVFDDRPQVIRMWKELGLFVFNVHQDPYNVEF